MSQRSGTAVTRNNTLDLWNELCPPPKWLRENGRQLKTQNREKRDTQRAFKTPGRGKQIPSEVGGAQSGPRWEGSHAPTTLRAEEELGH